MLLQTVLRASSKFQQGPKARSQRPLGRRAAIKRGSVDGAAGGCLEEPEDGANKTLLDMSNSRRMEEERSDEENVSET